MTDWYYHAPGEGRVGPLSAEALRARALEHRLGDDTLVWRDGLGAWQPLRSVAQELGLGGGRSDRDGPDRAERSPPPLPLAQARPAAAIASPAPVPTPGMHAAAQAASRRSRKTGCLIALAAVAGLGVVTVGILAAIAVPAYQDYVLRTKIAAVAARVETLKPLVDARYARMGDCGRHAESGPRGLADGARSARLTTTLAMGPLDDGRCSIVLTLHGPPHLEGRQLRWERGASREVAQWRCRSDLDAGYLPTACRMR